MAAVVYTAKRSVIAGHSVDAQYTLNLRIVEGGLSMSRKVGAEVQRTLSDKTETLYYYGKTAWNVTALAMTSTELAELQEFLHSVEAQESFTFSPYGVAGSLGTTYTVRRVQGNYSLERLDGTGGNNPANDAMRVNFEIEEA
jgi:hypothetical protein